MIVKSKMNKIFAADLFCGAGGSSTGLVKAIKERRLTLDLLAVNHWNVAVATHTLNHPWARHLCADLSSVDPSKAIPGGKLDILIASPECTHHSNARGGKPRSDQSRASAWHVLHWAERLQIKRILIENVMEFENWGPLKNSGIPDAKRKGETFSSFVSALRSLGYSVDWRVLNAADYGDATSRKRLFIQASRNGRIEWPVPSHSGKWKPAKSIIDWDLHGTSISNRKRPLAPKTLDRIEAGLKKFGGEPFIAVLRGTDKRQSNSWAKSINDPLGTISCSGAHAALCEPFLISYHAGKGRKARVHAVDDPVPTVTTENRYALCSPFIITMEHSGRQPVRSTDLPLPTITTAKGGSFGLCRPFLTKYYGTAKARSVDIPIDTITGKDRFALVEPYGMDIYFRMLQPHELAAAMGFDNYKFFGTKTDQVKQIGNAVSVRTSQAICSSILSSITH
ncbi:MAG: DNA cytosine methyltransferase [Lentisphaerota bacterium]